MSAPEAQGLPMAGRYLPGLRDRRFYQTSTVIIVLPLAIQVALVAWLGRTIASPAIDPWTAAIVPVILILALAAVHARTWSTLRKLGRLKALVAHESGPSAKVDVIIVKLFRTPFRLLAMEIPLALVLLVPLAIHAQEMDPRLLEPVLLLPAMLLITILPAYVQTSTLEILRLVQYMPPPTDPAILDRKMSMVYLLGSLCILFPTGCALFQVYKASHVVLLVQSGSMLNIVPHAGSAPVLLCCLLLAGLSALMWLAGKHAGSAMDDLSRIFEAAFRAGEAGVEPGTRITREPAARSFITEIAELKVTANAFAEKLRGVRSTQRKIIEGLEQAQKVKTVFLASMSHDLKSPLNSIIGFSELMLRGVEGEMPAAQKDDIRLIHASGEELLGLINSILDSARLEAGKLELHKEWTPSVELISNVVKTGQHEIGTKHIAFESEIQPGLPPVFVDPHRISQAIGNLISNAIKFMEEGTVTVRAYVHRTDDVPSRRFLRIDVSDTGQGIREEDRDRIFEAFQQIDRSYSRKSTGMGLGLTLTRNLVALHDGKLAVTSEIGKGSTFSISLPLE